MSIVIHGKVKNFEKRPNNWNNDGHMDFLFGTEVIVRGNVLFDVLLFKDGEEWKEIDTSHNYGLTWLIKKSDLQKVYKKYKNLKEFTKLSMPELLI